MSRLPGERAPVSAPSSASLLAPAARDARAAESARGDHRGNASVRRRPGFSHHKRVARNWAALSFEFC